MKIAILGAGAMGSVLGAMLSRGPNDVTLIDVYEPAVEAINRDGVTVLDKEGHAQAFPLRATSDPQSVGKCDVVLVMVKCYDTEQAVRNALPMLDDNTVVLSLQNGWGNGPRIAGLVGAERVLVGVTYHSATVLDPGRIHHAGSGRTVIGKLSETDGAALAPVLDAFSRSGIEVEGTAQVKPAIWSKLCLNVCTLPTSALLRFRAGELGEHEGTRELMQALLRETVSVAQAQDVALDYDERWSAIMGVVQRAAGAKASMLQDVEKRRRTEIDVINGAVVAAGIEYGIPTPFNQTMVWMVKSLEETFA